MHFLNWLLEQDEGPGGLGLFSSVVYNDINNGCGARFTDPLEWQEHFNTKHKRTAKVLNGLLTESYIAFTESFSAEK